MDEMDDDDGRYVRMFAPVLAYLAVYFPPRSFLFLRTLADTHALFFPFPFFSILAFPP